MRHITDLTKSNPPPAKRQKTTHEYLITVEEDFNITLQAGEIIATSTYALIYPSINDSYKFIENLCKNNDPISTLLAFGNKLNITFIIYDLKTRLVYHNIKTYPKKEMLTPIQNANYLICSDGDWYRAFQKKIKPSNRLLGNIYGSYYREKNPDECEFEVRFEIARLSIEMLAKFPQNKLFEPNPYYTDDTPKTVELVKKVLDENNYPHVTQHLFDELSKNLSGLIKQVNKLTQKINETNITTNINFFTRIKDFLQFNQNVIGLLKIFYLKRIENILNQIDRFQNKQDTLNEITKFIVLTGEKLPNFTEEIIRFAAQVMKNLYLKNVLLWSNITFFANTLQENITLNIDIDNNRADNLTTLIGELFHNDILSLRMCCIKHIRFWSESDQQKASLNTLPNELQEQLKTTLQHSDVTPQ